ncbi:uncharacterized protein METZ01_LOCUS394481, partial [marine metagenome]
PASAGDWVAAFDEDDNIAGADELIMEAGSAYINVTIYGDDNLTPDVDEGINAGEDFVLRLWDSSADMIYEYSESFDCWYNNNGAPMDGCGDYNTEYDFGEEVPPPGEPDFSVTMNVAGGDLEYDLVWGMSPDATDGFDPFIDDYAPPPPPPPSFDAALGWMGERYYTQIIASNISEITMDVLLQYPEDNVITITWDNNGWGEYFESILLEDAFGGLLVSVDMLAVNSLELNDPAINILIINFIASGELEPPWEELVTPTPSSGVFQGQALVNGVPASPGDWVAAFDE